MCNVNNTMFIYDRTISWKKKHNGNCIDCTII
jgi:hypothetical protein